MKFAVIICCHLWYDSVFTYDDLAIKYRQSLPPSRFSLCLRIHRHASIFRCLSLICDRVAKSGPVHRLIALDRFWIGYPPSNAYIGK